MSNTKYSLVITLICFCSFFSFLYAQDFGTGGEKLEKRVERYIQWMEREEDLWKASARLTGLGIQAIPYIKESMKKSSEIAQVGCAKAIITLNDYDYGLEVLLRVLEKGTDAFARSQAALLIGNYGDYDLDIEKKLNNIMENDFDPNIKIAVAKALWLVGKNPQATKTLKQFLTSDREDLKISAALILAEIGNVQEVKPILSDIKEEPTLRGRLAQSLLDQERVRSYYERKLRAEANKNKNVNNDKDPNKENTEVLYPTVQEIIKKIKEYHIYGDKLTEDEIIRGILSKTDTYSAFWNEKEYEEFVKSMEKEEYVGIGVYVDKDDNEYIISGLIYNGPAYKAGIRAKDRIIEIGGFPTENASMEELVEKIRGKEGQSITLKILRKNWESPKEIVVTREKVKIPHVFSAMLPGKIGYILLTQFGQKAAQDIKTEIATLQKDNLQALVLDLRGNGGGWLQIAVDIVDIFLPEGKLVVYSEGRHPVKGKRYERRTSRKNNLCEVPLVLLIDGDSASASEVVAGALQHYKRAVIIGERSFGKGSIQEPLELATRPNTRLKLTIAMYYLPDGRCIHNESDGEGKITKHNGIVPDISVQKITEEKWKSEEKKKLDKQNVFYNYLERFYSSNQKLFHGLAENDHKNSSLYPEFDTWLPTLETKASNDDVRRWLRETVREKAEEDIGKEFACDYVEDSVLQSAILELCKKNNIDPKTIAEYKFFSK